MRNLLGLLDWRINGKLSRLVQREQFSGQARELLLMPGENRFKAQEVLLLGMGARDHFQQDHMGQVFDFFFQTLDKKKTSQICFSLFPLLPNEFEWRNAVRLLISKWTDHPTIQEVILHEPAAFIRDLKRRQVDFGHQVKVEYQ